jgi:pyridinium-3,5-biscarboxylic acid mononucleotide synthase
LRGVWAASFAGIGPATAAILKLPMDQSQLRALLEEVRAGAVDIDAALDRLRHLPFEDLGFAKVDHHRALRHGMPEVIFGPGKTPDQISSIAAALLAKAQNVLVTRISREIGERLQREHPSAEYFPASGSLRVWRDRTVHGKGTIAVVCAGTSDLPVAEEAQVTAEVMGNQVDAIHDIGVAGIHRLMHHRERLGEARVVIVCAGMEGALPSVVGGLVKVPVIAVPTSIGYGASFGGIAALLAMLNSCVAGITVVNIDNGFGAAAAASRINHL